MMKDPYVYSGTEVLKNLAGIKEENAFACMEAEYTSLRIADLSIDNTLSYSDFNDLCMTHVHCPVFCYLNPGKLSCGAAA